MASWSARKEAIEGADSRTVHDRLTARRGRAGVQKFCVGGGESASETAATLESPTGTLVRADPGLSRRLTVSKVWAPIFMDRALYKKYRGDDAVDFIDVDLNPGVDQLAMKQPDRAAHRRLLPRLRLHQRRVQALDLQPRRPVLHPQLCAYLIVAVLIAILGIVNTLSDFRIRAPARNRHRPRHRRPAFDQIRKLVLLEAVAVAVVGVIVGSVAGMLNTVFMSHTVSAGAGRLFRAVLFSAGICPAIRARRHGRVASPRRWRPARNAARLQVIEAIGYE